jgi:hypothetical protein
MGVACKPSPRVEAASPLHRSPPATHAASHMQKHSDERAAARARNARLLHDACALAAPPRRGTPAVAALIAARGRYLAAVRLLELRAAAEAKAAAAAVASPAAVFVPPPPALAAPAPPAASVEAAAPTTAAAAEPRRPASPVPRPESSLRFQGGAETEWSSDEGADDGSSDGDAGHKSAAAVAAAAPLEAAAKQAMPPSSSPPPPPPLPPLPAVGGIVPRLDLTGLRPAATEAGLAQGQGDEKVEQSARAPPEARVPRTEPPTAAPAASAAYASAALSPASRRSASGVSPRTGESALLSLGANWVSTSIFGGRGQNMAIAQHSIANSTSLSTLVASLHFNIPRAQDGRR